VYNVCGEVDTVSTTKCHVWMELLVGGSNQCVIEKTITCMHELFIH